MALPPTATAWTGCSISTPSKMSSMRSRTLRISAAEGGIGGDQLVGEDAGADPPGAHLARRRPATVPRITSVEPPPTSTTPTLPSTGWPEGLGRADEGESPLLLVAQHVDRDAGRIADRGRDLAAVGGLAHGRRRHRAYLLGAQLSRQAHLGGDDLADFVDLRGKDRAIGVERLVDPRVGALLHHLLQLAVDRLSDEHAGGVGADIDGSAESHRPLIHLPKQSGSQPGVKPAGCEASSNSRNSPVTTKATCSPMSTALSAIRSIARAAEQHRHRPLALVGVVADLPGRGGSIRG